MRREIKSKAWDVKKLKTEVKQEEYRKEINKIIRSQHEEEDIEKAWDNMKIAIEKATRKTKKEWYNERCRKAMENKVEARIKWIKTERQEHRENCKMEEIEKENKRKNARNFYQKVKQQIRTYKPKIRGIKNKEGKTVQAEEDMKEVWMNYFKEILNKEQAAKEIITAKGEESMEIKKTNIGGSKCLGKSRPLRVWKK
ncbi:hypothetical protein ILUMI_11967 [Ignelater luminosus]|uniref:Uncharacterized protein n=1 Tax=Ignelater luminosus TaxID=2038154 RepID=A0A8K0D0H7_IGNLU|nr:hypothetical protein ILUMI_11967 [Ignelater luminosus]